MGIVLDSSLSTNDCKQISKDNLFLQDVLIAWSKLNLTNQTGTVSKEIMWNNSEIKHDGKLIYYQHWYDRRKEHLYDFKLKRSTLLNKWKTCMVFREMIF